MVRIFKKINGYIPTASMIFVLLAVIAGIVHLACIGSEAFADFFNLRVSGLFRQALGMLTAWIPFSLAECIVFASPCILVTIYVICVRKSARGTRYFIRCIAGLLSVILLVYAMFVFVFAAGYRGTTLDRKMELDTENIAKEDLYNAMYFVRDRLNELADEVAFVENTGSVRPYSHEETVKLCLQSYDKLEEELGFINNFPSTVKQLVVSDLMTYTHISGMYTFFTGEANLNTNYPYFVNVFTTAHEMAHQRGIAREDEANFIAYLVCINSDDPYMQYSGYLSMYEYLITPMRKASKTLYGDVVGGLDERVKYDLTCYSRFFDKYRDNTAAKVSDTVNNTYLTMQGTEGTVSYDLVSELAIAYHAKNNPQ